MDALDSATKIEYRLVTKATIANIPLGATFELSPLCNMNCDMCFIRLSQGEMNQLGRLKTAKEWLSIAAEMKKAGTLFVLLTGGEPFLYPEFIEVYKGLKELGFIITINTNGTLLTDEIAEVLGKDKPRRVNITLYGASNETYDKLCHNPKGFDQTMKAIKTLKEKNVDIKLNGTLVPRNMHEYQALIDLAKDLNLYIKIDTYMFPGTRERNRPFCQESRMDPKTCATKQLETLKYYYSEDSFNEYLKNTLDRYEKGLTTEYIAEEKSITCRAGRSSFWITWQGHMTPCIFMKEPYIDVFKNEFNASWQYIIEKSKEIRMPLKCSTCEKQEICPICAATGYCENGATNQVPEYLCEYTDELLRQIKEMEK